MQAIRESDYFIALLSFNSLNKRGYVQSELKEALETLKEIPESQIYLIPVRLEDCELSIKELKNLHWIDLFPSYETALKRIINSLKAKEATIPLIPLRTQPQTLSRDDISSWFIKNNLFEDDINKLGHLLTNRFKREDNNDDKVVIDFASGLMWQCEGSLEAVTYGKIEKFITGVNTSHYAGFSDWRLPTLEESWSLIENVKNRESLYINPIFNSRQRWIWTSDSVKGKPWGWVVYFDYAICGNHGFYGGIFVRAVRSMTPANTA